MATVKEIYQLIKEREKQGKKIGILQQSIIAAIASCKASRFLPSARNSSPWIFIWISIF